ncbi:unnamed protein product [Chondrus crispus]|uniref:Uncharacterized protein n=1 Tax=Chondrus crispus TaxID=2769 RepID=R7Q8R3_CHOCR|nr:unnamed protein product [Chondrus crispus]CDF34424.1 unnamed protein product [Chondrus crispus]|eukprot:XP_005714243.1 unnamed protein product [Chondrus crispus]
MLAISAARPHLVCFLRSRFPLDLSRCENTQCISLPHMRYMCKGRW